MKLHIRVPVIDKTSDDPDVLALVEAAIARQASAWTEPVYQGETDDDGHRHLHYLTDAQPR